MRSKKRIKPFMKWLTKEWENSPDLRFGQFLINKGIVDDGIHWHTEISQYPIPHKVMREIQTWGSKGRDIFIKDLDIEHIKAILKTQTHIQDTSLEKILKAELKFKKKK